MPSVCVCTFDVFQTYESWYMTDVDVCETCMFRVAAVNQFGTRGFSNDVLRGGKCGERGWINGEDESGERGEEKREERGLVWVCLEIDIELEKWSDIKEE